MRSFRIMLALSGAFSLAACGGGTGPETVGGIAPPAAAPTPGVTPAPTHSFVAPTDPKTYDGIGAVQHYEYATRSSSDVTGNPNKTFQFNQVYAGDATTPRDGGISITYNPRDAIFDLTISRPNAEVSGATVRFQDPMHRTAFGGPIEPQVGTPNFSAERQIQYLQSGSSTGTPLSPDSPFYTIRDANGVVHATAAGSDYPAMSDQSSVLTQTLFYQKFGTTTKYVSYAGFLRTSVSGALIQPTDPSEPAYLQQSYRLDRAAFAFGERTATAAVPTSGGGTFTGDMFATMVVNVDPTSRADATNASYLQWMQGNASLTIDFAKMSVDSVVLNGTVITPGADDAYTNGRFAVPVGTAFHAEGKALIDMKNRGGFTGQFGLACFAAACTGANSLVIAGSSVDGTFFGPAAEEVGGGFRIVGGHPDQRIDILGAFTGKK